MLTATSARAGLLMAAFASACAGGQDPGAPTAARVEPTPIALSVPGRSNAAVSVAAFGQTVAAAWTATTEDTPDIFLSVSSDGGVTFGPAVRVNDIEGDARAFGEQAARTVVGTGNIIHVVWPARRDDRSVIRYARSTDLGRTFSSATTVAGGDATGARGWHAVTLGHDGGVHLVWLDGRNAAPSQHRRGHAHATPGGTSAARGPGPRQDIFHASWIDGGNAPGPRTERAIQAGVCFCCKTAVATAGERVYAAFRHIYPGSLRDIAVARSTDNGATFGDLLRVSEDGWQIDACPDDGPAMAADGHGGIHVVWPTLVSGETPSKGIFYSTLAGEAFAPRLRLDSGASNPAHPQIAADHHTDVAAVWDERGETRRIVFRRVTNGIAEPPQSFDDEGASYPVVAAGEGYWIVLWSAEGADGRSVIAGRRIPAPPAQ